MRFATIALLASILALGVGAPDAWGGDPTTAEVVPGEHWVGAQITGEDLVGKVVLFVLWGS